MGVPWENGPKTTECGPTFAELSVFREASDGAQPSQPKLSEHLSNSDVPVTHILGPIRCDTVFPLKGKFTDTILRAGEHTDHSLHSRTSIAANNTGLESVQSHITAKLGKASL